MKFKAILFDVDGVLVDSEPPFMECCISFLKEKYGLEIKPEYFTDFVGKGEDAAVCGVVTKAGGEYLPQMKDECYDVYLERAEDLVPAAEGMRELLPTLRKDYKLAVASSADRRKVKVNLAVVGADENSFDAVITGSEIVNKKPDPEIYLKAAEAVGISPADCLVVEDAVSGVTAGKAAGCKVVAVGGSFGKAELIAAGADFFVEKTKNIVDVL